MKVLPIVVAGAKFLQDYAKSRALDYGAGTGRNSIYLANLGIDVLAVDQDIEELEKLAINNKMIHPVKADLRNWEIQGKFDLVVATNVLQFFDNDTATRCLMDITNCLNSGGVLCLTYILDKKISFYISQAFHMASFCGTGAVIFISSLLTGWMNSSILACRLMPPSGLERGAPYFRSPFIGTPILDS